MQTTRSATIRYHGEKCRCRSSETKVSRAQMRFKSNQSLKWKEIMNICNMFYANPSRSETNGTTGEVRRIHLPGIMNRNTNFFWIHQIVVELLLHTSTSLQPRWNKEPEYTTRVQSVHSAFLLSQQETPFYAAADRKQSTYLWTCREWSTASPWREFV